ncbi:outer membrane lipoprotein chaperone LolA [Planctobacterium marinum]|uniref:Outer-membrane lipoprotein carrier protein n=1 Tax=Planctobacterium marinum TaxID=1631968 RepID=A0AA48KSM4_9ALTE|nr:outer-membrane lipoprotein carrier protein [Planctobacterium marinum]
MLKKLAFLLVFSAVNSQVFSSESDKNKLQEKLAQLQSFSASFEQIVSDVAGETLQTAQGKLYLQQPQKLYWESFEPNEMQLIADGETLWHIDPFVEQVIAINQADAAQNHPIMLLADQQSAMWQNYLVEETAKSQFKMLSLLPDSDFLSLTLVFESDRLTQLTIVDKMEQRNHLTFSSVEQNQTIPASLFQFDLPDGYELDDQR